MTDAGSRPATPRIGVIIPALNEAGSIAGVIARIPPELHAVVIVADNGSTDQTAGVAREAGATVVEAAHRGYGHACFAAVQAVGATDILVFIDGDGSMAPEEISALVAPIQRGEADIVGGARPRRGVPMPWHQRAGNRVIALLLRRHGVDFPELCPFRAVRTITMQQLNLPPSRFAWPAQLLARASRHGSRMTWIPVGYAERTAGASKVGGSVRGSLAASWDIARTLLGEPRHRARAE